MSLNQHPSSENWAETLFVNQPQLYLPVLESMREQSKAEVDGLCRVFEEFKVPIGSKILDFSCGIGRHSINLVKKGYQVVGYDPSPFYIDKANLYADQELLNERHKIRFYQGRISDFKDVLTSNKEYDFDVIIIMFTSIGLLNENEDIRILNELLTLARTGCILVMETENRDKTIMNPLIRNIYEFNEVLINEAWTFDQYASILQSTSKFYQKDSGSRSLHLQLELQMKVRLYSLHELIQLINYTGWKFLKSYGDIKSLDDVSINSINLITVSQKL
jgi:SAM-dependent methyltransferase